MNQQHTTSDGHDPLSVLNHASVGIRTMITCSCGLEQRHLELARQWLAP